MPANNNPTQPVQQRYVPLGIYNGPIPQEGPKTIPVSANFATVASYIIDFTLIYSQRFITEIQAVWIDNSTNNQAVTLTNLISNQSITFGAGRQGIVPVLCPNPPKFQATSSGNGTVQFQFLNVPITCLSWPTSNTAFAFDGSGNLLVDDPTLNALMASIVANGGIINEPAAFTNFAANNAGTQIKTGAGTLLGVSVNTKGATSTISLYDAVSATNPIAVIDSTALGSYFMNGGGLSFVTGLFVVLAGGTAANVTILWR